MDYYKKRLKLLKEIKKRGDVSGITRICNKVYNSGRNSKQVIDRLEKAKIISLKKTKSKTYSSLTSRGEKLVKILDKLDELLM